MGAELHSVRERSKEVGKTTDDGREASGHIPFSPGAKQALVESLHQAVQLGHDHIGAEHLALGLLRDRDGDAVRVLAALGVDIDALNRDISASAG